MKIYDNSEKTARLMLDDYVKTVTDELGDSIEAIILLGSLVYGGYIPDPGDIDQITILKTDAEEGIEQKALALLKKTMGRYNNAVNMATTIYRRSQLNRPWQIEYDCTPESKHLVTVPEELLRIHDHGQVIWGNIDISSLPKPTIDEMKAYHMRWRKWNEVFFEQSPDHKKMIESPSLRIAVASVISMAIWHYYYATGKPCFNKGKIHDAIKSEIPDYRYLDILKCIPEIRKKQFKNIPDDMQKKVITGFHVMYDWNIKNAVGEIPITL